MITENVYGYVKFLLVSNLSLSSCPHIPSNVWFQAEKIFQKSTASVVVYAIICVTISCKDLEKTKDILE